MSATIPVLSRKTVAMLDRVTIERLGIPGLVLMENAGSGCARLIAERLRGGTFGEPVLVLAGPGNNGGDGFVIARHLHNARHECHVYLLGGAAKLARGSDAHANLKALRGTGVPLFEVDRLSEGLVGALDGAGCIVDAVFGTGLDRRVEGLFADVIEAANGRPAPVFAVDVPSGLDAETGEILGTAVKAAATGTFAVAKPGLLRGAGPAYAGELHVVPISIPSNLIETALEDEGAFLAWAEHRLASEGP